MVHLLLSPAMTMPRLGAKPLLAACLTLLGIVPSLGPAMAFPRGGFGGGGMRFGGDGGGFGGYHFGGAGYDGRHPTVDWQRGYQGYHPQYGPNSRPAWQESGTWKDEQWRTNRNFNNDTFEKNVNVNNNFYNRNVNGWNANWARGGYWNNRPWNAGWYGWSPSTWGWWGWNSAGWGLAAGLATGAAITSLVDSAADRQQTVIVVPGSSYQLNYGSVEAVGQYGVSFSYNLGDGANLMGAANCQAGLLNGQVPATAAQAQLLNAVCQVAYGKGS